MSLIHYLHGKFCAQKVWQLPLHPHVHQIVGRSQVVRGARCRALQQTSHTLRGRAPR